MSGKKQFSFKKPIAYAAFSTAAVVAMFAVPAAVAYADITFTGNSSILGEVVITAPAQIEDESNAFASATVVLQPTEPDTEFNLGNISAAKVVIGNNNVGTVTVTPEQEVTKKTVVTNEPDVVDTADEKVEVNLEPFELSIMHMNDTHAALDDMPKTVTAVNEVRAEKPDSLLLHAGDIFSGTLYFNEFEGRADLDLFNLMDFDAMTFGNHEFDLGSSEEGHQALADFIKGSKFPYVSSNVNFSGDERFTGLFSDLISSEPKDGEIYNGIIKEIDGEKVGIFGLTTEDTANIASPGEVKFEDYLEEAEKAVKAFEGQGVNKIIALTHIGFDDNADIDNDLELAANVAGIDIIVGGHTHTSLAEPVVVNENDEPTIIVQAGANNSYLGTLDVTFDENGVITEHAGELISIRDQEPNAEAVDVLAPFKERVDEVSNQEIGVTAKVDLTNPRTGDEGNTTGESVRKNETILGNLVTDGMLAKAKSFTKQDIVMALQNGGGIRAPIAAGPITTGQVITVLPFGNTLATMDVTGAELKAAFEHSVSQYPNESGGFLHVAGGKVEFDSTKKAGERVVTIAYLDGDNYVEIEDEKTYTVATNAFTAQGGDGYDMFATAYGEGRVADLGLSDWENLRDHLISLDEIPTEIEGRIVDVAGEASSEDPEELQGGKIPANEFSGTEASPKVYNGDVTVDVTNVSSLENAVIKGDLILTGKPSDTISFSNITVEGELNAEGLDGVNHNFTGINVKGENGTTI